MSNVKEIITDIEKLGEWSTEINTRKDGKLMQEIVLALKATMRENDLTSLSAPQIGYNYRILCLRFGKNDYRTFINPMIENNTGLQMSRETCSSIPGKTYIMPRFAKIKVYYETPLSKVESANLAGRASYAFQHAIDHLNGMTIDTYGLEIDELFDNATDDERAEVLKMYAESLDIRQKQLDKEINEDKELKDIDDAVKFINSVKSGETKLDVPIKGEKE